MFAMCPESFPRWEPVREVRRPSDGDPNGNEDVDEQGPLPPCQGTCLVPAYVYDHDGNRFLYPCGDACCKDQEHAGRCLCVLHDRVVAAPRERSIFNRGSDFWQGLAGQLRGSVVALLMLIFAMVLVTR